MQKWFWVGLIFGFCQSVFGQSYKIHHHRGDSLFAVGSYAESLAERFKALSQIEKSGTCKQLSVCYLQVGRAYYYLQNRDEARVWIQRSLSKAQSCSFDSLVGINLRNIGAIFIEANKPDSAILYLNKARLVLLSGKKIPELANLFAMLFEVELRGRKNLTAARQWLDSCQVYYHKLKDPNQMAFYLIKEGIYWQAVRDFSKAELFFKRAFGLYQTISSTEGKMYALVCLASLQNEAGKFKEAFQTQTRYMGLRDTVFKEQTAQNLARYQTMFETQKKEIENLELKRQNERQLTGFGIGILVLTLGGFGIFKIRETSHQRKLEAQKRENQRIRFSEVVQAQEEERTRIARDLHDGLGHLIAAIKLNTSALEVSDEQNRKILGHAGTIIDQASKEVRQISHRLMPQSLSDLGLEESIQELAHRINESGKIKVEILTTSEIWVEQQMAIGIYRIVQEVMNNALKHAQASIFSIQYGIENEMFTLILMDNGKGFDIEQIEKSAGIGWKNIRSRVELLNGRMQLESKLGVGTKVEVQIPFLPDN